MTKHIFITGGVVSSLGKGITSASIALLLSRRGYRVKLQKLDPYLNVDPGTMSPYQHGEVYVTSDGAETDLDLGHYERFTGIPCSKNSNFTAGKIYSAVIARERAGGYLGKTVQVIPHITDEIKSAILSLDSEDVDIAITEIGGTVGDIESLPFLEAIRQLHQELGKHNALFIHITLVPFIKAAGELKTKPSQQSVGILRSIGIFPEILICRCEKPLSNEHKEKLSLFCNVARELVVEERDVEHSIYEVPLNLAAQDLDVYILEKLDLHVNKIDLSDWQRMLNILINPTDGEVSIGVVGKYITLQDAYKSIYEALTHGGIYNNCRVNIKRIESEPIEKYGAKKMLHDVHGVLIPGGFGYRGVHGKILAIEFARKSKLPVFGICLGMQCAVIEIARNLCELKEANSTEFDPDTPYPVIDLLPEQKNIDKKGGTMRLGSYLCVLKEDSLAYKIYRKREIFERHRHRYEFNNLYREKLEKKGVIIAGENPERNLVEIIELKDHPWFIACQYHPEFQSTPLNAHPLFADFIRAAKDMRNGKLI